MANKKKEVNISSHTRSYVIIITYEGVREMLKLENKMFLTNTKTEARKNVTAIDF